jgi:hypothetical protein
MEATKALEDIQNKHRDVVKIEKSILELQQLFMDMAVLVAAQGEVVDQIAVHVDNAVNDTDEGVKALQKAVKIQKQSRKVSTNNVENVLDHTFNYYCHSGYNSYDAIFRWHQNFLNKKVLVVLEICVDELQNAIRGF